MIFRYGRPSKQIQWWTMESKWMRRRKDPKRVWTVTLGSIVLMRLNSQWSGRSQSEWASKVEVMVRVTDSWVLNVSGHLLAGFSKGPKDGWPSSRVTCRPANISQKRRHYFFHCVLGTKKSFLEGLNLSPFISQRPEIVAHSILRSLAREDDSYWFSKVRICVKEDGFPKQNWSYPS